MFENMIAEEVFQGIEVNSTVERVVGRDNRNEVIHVDLDTIDFSAVA